MQPLLRPLFLLGALLFAGCSPEPTTGSAADSESAALAQSTEARITEALISQQESDETARCRLAAQGMIDVAEQAVNDSSSRPERREARRALFEDWTQRLAAGTDPCELYGEIIRASTTF